MLPRIESSRLLVRRYRTEDKNDLYEQLSDPETLRFEPYPVFSPEQMDQEVENRVKSDEFFAVVLKETGKVIGNLYLGRSEGDSREIGFVFHRGYWGKGFATEACAAVLREAFASGIHRITAQCDPQNPRSWRLLKRLGMTRVAHLRKNIYFWTDDNGNPLWKDTFVYAISDGGNDPR